MRKNKKNAQSFEILYLRTFTFMAKYSFGNFYFYQIFYKINNKRFSF